MVWNLLLLEAETVYLNGQVKFGMQTTGSLELYIGNFFRPSHGIGKKIQNSQHEIYQEFLCIKYRTL